MIIVVIKMEFKYSFDNKRYHTLNYHYSTLFGFRVSKISLNGGFTCPNKDGKVAIGGCIYCSPSGSGDFAGNVLDDLVTQFYSVKNVIDKKWKNTKYIGYFQANSNTYAKVDELRSKYECILNLEDVVGLSIATRCDCIDDNVLDYLIELNKRTYLTVELGLQTIHDSTSKLINRAHDLKCFYDTFMKIKKNKIKVVVHIINGLPYETKEMMIETVKYLNSIKIDGIKIHMLHILKGTKLESIYNRDKFKVLTKEEYVDIVCDQLEYLDENIVIHRITGDPNVDDLIEPIWLTKKFGVLNEIDLELAKRGTYQGFNKTILNRFKLILNRHLREKDLVVDATVGNGNDTLTLSNIVTKGHVFGFDIQDIAIRNTDKLLKDFNKSNYTLFNKSHELIEETLFDYKNKISAVVFNLGYLPNGNKQIITRHDTTLNAIKGSLNLLNNKGIILVVVYPHEEGLIEAKEIEEYISSTNYKLNKYFNTDNKNAPYLIKISL